MDYPKREDLKIGSKFSNFELLDHNDENHKLSQLLHGFSGVLIFARGHFCPKDRHQMANYVQHLQPELHVNYTHLITVSVDDARTTQEVRDQLNTNWTFLCDTDQKLLHELEMVDTKDDVHGEMYIPYTFILERDRTIYKIYDG